jgi:shikimate dehydrogenase
MWRQFVTDDGTGIPAPAAGQEYRAAVLGSPIVHSLSPVLHTAAYTALGLTGWGYDRIECDERRLPGLLDRMGVEWVGLSLTMPLKRVALEVADEVSPLAEVVGAANTLLLRPGGRRAENTDVLGIVEALREAGVAAPSRPLLLGAGGTAQAALAALHTLGCPSVTVLVRDPARVGVLRACAQRLGVRAEIIGGFPGTPIPDADLIISTLPATGADSLAAYAWPGRPVVLDVVYAPWPTPMAASAAAAGCSVISGLAVLLHQAAGQVRLMTGRGAPVEAMRAALERSVAR